MARVPRLSSLLWPSAISLTQRMFRVEDDVFTSRTSMEEVVLEILHFFAEVCCFPVSVTFGYPQSRLVGLCQMAPQLPHAGLAVVVFPAELSWAFPGLWMLSHSGLCSCCGGRAHRLHSLSPACRGCCVWAQPQAGPAMIPWCMCSLGQHLHIPVLGNQPGGSQTAFPTVLPGTFEALDAPPEVPQRGCGFLA